MLDPGVGGYCDPGGTGFKWLGDPPVGGIISSVIDPGGSGV